jgi:hypothetical protein
MDTYVGKKHLIKSREAELGVPRYELVQMRGATSPMPKDKNGVSNPIVTELPVNEQIIYFAER